MSELNVGPLTNGGGTFDFAAYLSELEAGTQWLAAHMERRLGMESFIRAHHAVHRTDYYHPERTLKCFVLSEAESF